MPESRYVVVVNDRDFFVTSNGEGSVTVTPSFEHARQVTATAAVVAVEHILSARPFARISIVPQSKG